MAESELPKLTPKLLAEFNPHPPVDAGALRRATLTLDLSALRHNAEIAKKAAGGRKIMAAVKADGYGHGAATVAHALRESVDGFMVAT